MNKRLQDLLDKRAVLVAAGRTIRDAADKEKRNLTTEENANDDARLKEVLDLTESITREERQIELERELAASQADKTKDDGKDKGKEDRAKQPGTPEYRALAYRKFLLGGKESLDQDERRALQADNNVLGGYLVPPEEFIKQLIQAVDDQVFIRGLATKFQVGQSDGLGVPSLDADPADADWTSELATGSEDSTMAFGKRELKPFPLAKRIKVSNKLLERAAIGPEAIVRERLAYKFAVTEEKAFLTGSGAGQPLGVFTASAQGIPTTRDVSTDNTTTAMTFDGLMNAKYNEKSQYWPRLKWIFHRDGVKQVAKIKDGDGRYIWETSVQVGTPDRLLGFPVLMSEYAPNTFTTLLYVGLLGDFSNYWIADALSMRMQRLVELYAETNQVGFILRTELDGMPVLAEAFTRVKLG